MSMPSASDYPQAEQLEQAGQGVVDGAGGGAPGDEGSEFHAVEAEGGGSGSIFGRRTYSAGELGIVPSITAKR